MNAHAKRHDIITFSPPVLHYPSQQTVDLQVAHDVAIHWHSGRLFICFEQPFMGTIILDGITSEEAAIAFDAPWLVQNSMVVPSSYLTLDQSHRDFSLALLGHLGRNRQVNKHEWFIPHKTTWFSTLTLLFNNAIDDWGEVDNNHRI